MRGVSSQRLARLLGEELLSARDLRRELDEHLDIHTPYGKLTLTLDLPSADGSCSFPWICANHFALVRALRQLNAGYVSFLKVRLVGRVGRLVLCTIVQWHVL